MSEAKYIQRLPEKALDALYASLSVQSMPEGRYDGRAWIYGHPVLGWLASLVWRGKVFYQVRSRWRWGIWARNRVLGLLLFRGRVWGFLPEGETVRPYGHQFRIEYSWWLGFPLVPLTDYVRQVSPTLYLGRMQWRRWTVHFTLSQAHD